MPVLPAPKAGHKAGFLSLRMNSPQLAAIPFSQLAVDAPSACRVGVHWF